MMNQTSLLFDLPSVAIAFCLFLLMIGANEGGYHLGRYIQYRTDKEAKSLTGAIQASILGLLALILSFTFSMSMQRFDNRSMSLIDEANAIEAATLRVQLLPVEFHQQASALLGEYLEMRIQISGIDLTRRDERRDYNERIKSLQGQIWELAIAATQADPRAVTSGSFINALNSMIDSQGKRNALLQMRVPEMVLFQLFLVLAAAGGILGYSSGLSGTRVSAPTVVVAFIIAMIVFLIIDLDRPKRGVIKVDQSALLALAE
jgi:hypothetical protein